MKHTATRIGLGLTAAGVAVVGTIATAQPANAAPDTACQRAGIAALKDAGLLPTVAKNGVSLDYAVTELGVTPRTGTDVGALPSVLPFSVVLADHRAGDDSLFIYPWC